MPYDVNGTWTTDFSPAEDALQPEPDNYVVSDKFQDLFDNDLKTAFDLCFLRDGRVPASANFDMGGYKLTNLSSGIADGDSVRMSQLAGYAKTDLSNLTISASATETKKGVIEIATDAEALGLEDDSKAMTPAKVGLVLSSGTVFPKGYINGLIPEYVDADNIKINDGRCRDVANTLNVVLPSAFTKDLKQTWVVGTGNGGTAQGTSIGAGDTAHVFVIAGGVTPASAGYFVTDDISGNLASFQAVSDGYMSIQVDSGSLQNLVNLDFSLATSMDDVATIINNRITGATVSNVSGVLTFTSGSTGSNSSVSIINNPQDTGTNLYGASYLDVANGSSVQGADETASAVDVAIDTDVDGTNILADSNIASAGFTKLRRVCSIITDGAGDIVSFVAFSKSGGGARFVYNSNIDDYSGNLQNNTVSISIPSGITSNAEISFNVLKNDATFYFLVGAVSRGTASSTVWDYKATGASTDNGEAVLNLFIETTGDIVWSVSAAVTSVNLRTLGYVDERVA